MRPSYNEMKDQALNALSPKWGNAILATLIIFILTGIVGNIPLLEYSFGEPPIDSKISLLSILISGALSLGMAGFYLNLSRLNEVQFASIFDGFKRYFHALAASILMGLIIMGGFILLIVPGIIAAIALSQTYNIMHDNPEMGPVDAMKKSHEIMNGYKWDYFVFNLSFIGWALLCILTFGLGLLLLIPYISTANAVYYNYIIGNHTSVHTDRDSSFIDIEYKEL